MDDFNSASACLETKEEFSGTPSRLKERAPEIPDYLQDTYYWAYINPRNVRLLDREIELQGALFDHDREVVQLHFGGGTPTFHDDAQLKALMEQLGRHFSLSRDDDREFSIEVDPRTVGAERLEHLAAIGFNRISLGIQDINPEVQKAVNRVQDTKATLEMIDASGRRWRGTRDRASRWSPTRSAS